MPASTSQPAAGKGTMAAILEAGKGMGGLPLAVLFFIPRTSISMFVVGLAMICRAGARVFQSASGYQRKANLRLLIVTDYLPPQTHGIAIRFRQYIDYMRRAGHEVQVFCTKPSVRQSRAPTPTCHRSSTRTTSRIRWLTHGPEARLVLGREAVGPRACRLPLEHPLADAAGCRVAAHPDLRVAPRRHEVLHLRICEAAAHGGFRLVDVRPLRHVASPVSCSSECCAHAHFPQRASLVDERRTEAHPERRCARAFHGR